MPKTSKAKTKEKSMPKKASKAETKEKPKEGPKEEPKPGAAPSSVGILKQLPKKETKLKLIPSGIPGLDKIMGGGFPKNSSMLLSGVAGSGKTIFSMQYLYEGAMHFDEPGVMISLKETDERIIQELSGFNWDLKKAVEEKKLGILSTEIYRFESLLTTIEDAIDKYNAKRLVIDSCSVLGMFFENLFKTRRSLIELDRMLKRMQCTTIMTSQTKGDALSTFGIEEFVSDGIILLDYKEIRAHPVQYIRTLTVRKMRGLKHSNKEHICAVSESGLKVFPEKIY